MSSGNNVSQAICNIVKEMMDNVMHKVLVEDPFIEEVHHSKKPLYAALVPDEIFKGSHFERRFVTPFGNVWEKLALRTASAYHGHCEKGYTVNGTIGAERLRRIQEVLNRLEHPDKNQVRSKPNWNAELQYILEGGGEPIPANVVCDIYINSAKTGKKYSFELKAPLPNSDQTKVSKEKMFKLLAMNEHPIDEAYYALPYNPYGKRSDYSWSFPNRWFNMQSDSSVLIGDEFWDLIGGKGTYTNFIKEINKLGAQYKEKIYRDYLKIEPPVDFDKEILK